MDVFYIFSCFALINHLEAAIKELLYFGVELKDRFQN